MKNKASLFGISLKRTVLKLRGHLYHTVFLAFRLLSCSWTCLIVCPGGFSLSCCVSLLHTACVVHPKKDKTVSFQASLHGLFYNRTTLNGTTPFSLETTDCLKLALSRPSTSWKPSTGMTPLLWTFYFPCWDYYFQLACNMWFELVKTA